MYANKAVPCWMIFDEGYVRRYVTSANPLKRNQPLPPELIESGAVKRAATIAELAGEIGLPADELARTIQRFNRYAAKGLDPDFGAANRPTTTASAIRGIGRTPRSGRSTPRRTTRPAYSRPTSGRAGA